MKNYAVLKKGESIEFEIEKSTIHDLVERGYTIDSHIEAFSSSDAKIKFDEMLLARTNGSTEDIDKAKASDPSGYLKVMTYIFLAIGLISSLWLAINGFNFADSFRSEIRNMAKFYFIGSIATLVFTLLTHSACLCLVHITKRK